ncbi:hypothetical protein ACKF11_13345 [Methylobacillus sp. Pita2]|uniref:hypothetical protein n=1 Tax=Methylobacillus sp. Pita2 TaxID=3383245 RepID=UPI0038B64D82
MAYNDFAVRSLARSVGVSIDTSDGGERFNLDDVVELLNSAVANETKVLREQLNKAEGEVHAQAEKCICNGNLATIATEAEPFLSKACVYRGKPHTFNGVMVGQNDYYYVLTNHETGITTYLSCVGNFDSWDVTFPNTESSTNIRPDD